MVRPTRQYEIKKARSETHHVRGPTELAGNEDTGRVDDTVGDDDLLDLVTESIFDDGAQVAELGSLLLVLLLLLLGLFEFEALLGHAHELLALKLLELGDSVLVDGVDEEQDLETLLLKHLKEGRVADSSEGFASEVVDGLLDFGHAGDVV